MANEETALEVYVEDYLQRRRVKKPFPFLSRERGDGIDHITIEAMRSSHNFAAMMFQNFELQKNFILHVMEERRHLRPEERTEIDPIIRQMIKALNAGVMDQAEAAVARMGAYIEPASTYAQPAWYEKVWAWMNDTPALPKNTDRRGALRRFWEDY